jgi:hypothetical protein
MSNKIEQMLRKTEELLKASRNVRANTQGLSPNKAFKRLKEYHRSQGKKYNITDRDARDETPRLPFLDNVYTGYKNIHPAHEIAHAHAMGFPEEKDPLKPNWKGGDLLDWQLYIDNAGRHYDEGLGRDEELANQTFSLHARRAGVNPSEDVSSAKGMDKEAVFGVSPEQYWKTKRKNIEIGGMGSGYAKSRALAIQRVAQLRQKLIDLNIFRLQHGKWEKQDTPNTRINERQFRQEHPQEAEQLLGKPTIPQLKKK